MSEQLSLGVTLGVALHNYVSNLSSLYGAMPLSVGNHVQLLALKLSVSGKNQLSSVVHYSRLKICIKSSGTHSPYL